MTPLDRRHFLRLLALQAAAWSLSCGRHESGAPASRPAKVAGLPENPHAGRWLGDDFTIGHRIRDGEVPVWEEAPRSEPTEVVIVGAGISGLATACAIARGGRHVTVLEQAAEIGGNAKSARWGDIEYAIGAAYFTKPDQGSRLETLYRDLGVLDRARTVGHGDVFSNGRLVRDFWKGSTAAADAVAATRRVAEAFHDTYERRYPEIPWTPETPGWTRAQFERADRTPFSTHLDTIAAPADVRMFCEYYCWSSFGASASEISTYAALNFLTAEFGEVLALPGGNAAIAQALAGLARRRGVRIVTGVVAGRVAQGRNGVEVATLSAEGPRRWPARAAVLAVPRFIAKRIVVGYPEARAALVDAMKWRAYVVANVLVAKRPGPLWYDAYRIEPLSVERAGWTDLVLADFVVDAKPGYAVLTAYRALAFDAGRAGLLADDSFASHRDAVKRDLVPWLPALGLAERDIVDINLARWGHPLVVAQPGQLASGALEKISAPLGRIAFAHQDRFGVPAIENALAAAFEAADEVERMHWLA